VVKLREELRIADEIFQRKEEKMIAELIAEFEHESDILRRTLLAAQAVQEIVARCGDVRLPCVLRRQWTTTPLWALAALFEEQPDGFAAALLWKLAHEAEISTVYLKVLAQRLANAPIEQHEKIAEHWRMRAATLCPASAPESYANGWIAYRLGKGPGRGKEKSLGWLDSREDELIEREEYEEYIQHTGAFRR
jgi:hypothetical protein